LKFLLCTDAHMGKELKGLIGDYGKTIHAPHYIVLASREHEGYLTGGRWVLERFEVPGAAEAQSIGRYLVGTAWGQT
jgi:hypothetical protein